MLLLDLIIYGYIFLLGIIVGSFLNVCIYRIPKHEDIVVTRSHCMSCGYQLKWYDLVPVFSWIALKGRCRQCGEKVSLQYPLVEVLNGVLWVITLMLCGFSVSTIIMCLAISALIVLGFIDFRTYEIPAGINTFILVLAIIHTVIDLQNVKDYLLGFICISAGLMLLFVISKGQAIGGGDVKLMAASGLLLGWKLILLAFLAACLYGSVIHLTRMKISREGHVLAMGPYLSMGIVTAVWFGNELIDWYISLFYGF